MKIYLLTHQRELNKKTNSGQLVIAALGKNAERVIWKRKEPAKILIELFENQSIALLYPELKTEDTLCSATNQATVKNQKTSGEDTSVNVSPSAINSASASVLDYDNFIIIDSTWQESRKIVNRSNYLKDAIKVSLKSSNPSQYQLRRNQISNGLCTAECAIELLKIKNEMCLSNKLTQIFQEFNRPKH